MVRFAAWLIALVGSLLIGDAYKWDMKQLTIKDPLGSEVKLKDMQDRGAIQYLEWGWIFNADAPHHSRNLWHDLELEGNITTVEQAREHALKDRCFVRGTTLWVNEHMVVGHAMYDIQAMQLLNLVDLKVDRIVLQRAPCINADLCAGVGTWDGWFKGFYMAMLEAFSPDKPIPIYVRFAWQERKAKPICLGHKYTPLSETPCQYEWMYTGNPDNNASYLWAKKDKGPNECWEKIFLMQPVKAVERLFKRNCNGCFENAISADTVARFKTAARNLTKDYDDNSPEALAALPTSYFKENAPIHVTLAHRGSKATRQINNLQLLIDTLQHTLRPPAFELHIYNTSNNTRGYAEQMKVAMQTQIMIAEHGAWQSQMIYMRNGSLWIDMQGNYEHGEFRNFQKLARVFGVFYDHVTTKGLTFHPQDDFSISKVECLKVAELALQYASDKPYTFNVR